MKSLVVLNEMGFDQQQKEYLMRMFVNVSFYSDTYDVVTAIKRTRQAHIVILDQFLLRLDREFFTCCKNVELIIINTTAYDNVDLHLLNAYNVKLANLRDYATRDVAEVSVSMVLALNNNVQMAQKIVDKMNFEHNDYVHTAPVYDIWPGHDVVPMLIRHRLNRQTVGVVGLGNIGQEIARMFHSLGMQVIAFSRSRKPSLGIDIVPLRQLFCISDVLFIALSYDHSPAMKGLISAELLDSAKEGAILVSIAHPALIDMEHLIINHGKFRGIGLDYLVTEEVRRLREVRQHNIIITPHLGSQSLEAYSNMTEGIIEIALNFAQNKSIDLIN